MNSHFCVRLLGCWDILSEVLFTSLRHIENEMVFFSLLSQLKLVFGPLVILLVWHMLKQLFRLLCVKVVDFTSSLVNNYHEFFSVGFWGMKSFRYFLEVSSSSCANLLVGESGCEARFVSIPLLCLEKLAKW